MFFIFYFVQGSGINLPPFPHRQTDAWTHPAVPAVTTVVKMCTLSRNSSDSHSDGQEGD